jgi:hypothetical protein
MALKDITSQKDLIEERDRNQKKVKQNREDAMAAQKNDLKRANYAKERRVGNNIAYQQFKRSGTEGIDTEPDLIDRVMGASKDDAKYQSAKEMKKALESERARAGLTSSDQQKELKDLYETGISDRDIAAAKGNKKGGVIKKMAKGGTASSRADGCAVRGKTRA